MVNGFSLAYGLVCVLITLATTSRNVHCLFIVAIESSSPTTAQHMTMALEASGPFRLGPAVGRHQQSALPAAYVALLLTVLLWCRWRESNPRLATEATASSHSFSSPCGEESLSSIGGYGTKSGTLQESYFAITNHKSSNLLRAFVASVPRRAPFMQGGLSAAS